MNEKTLRGGLLAAAALAAFGTVIGGAPSASAQAEEPSAPASATAATAADTAPGEPAAEPAAAPPAPAEPPCTAAEFRQLDFWVGDWDLTWEGGQGTNTVTRELGDCVIEERFSGDMGEGQIFDGRSLSTYDRQAGVWKQTWVDNEGGYLDFTGGPEGDRFVLSRDGVRDGKPIRQRMVFYNITADSLDWNWEQSVEGGEWELRWKIHYQRR